MMIDVSWNQNQVITTVNQKKGKYFKSQWELWVKLTKMLKAQENAD